MPAFLGEFEQMVLLAVLHGGDEAFGAGVQREIEQRTGRSVNLGAVYTTLARLEEKGLVASRIAEPTAQRGGRRRRCYLLLPAGRRQLERSLASLRQMTRGLTPGLELP